MLARCGAGFRAAVWVARHWQRFKVLQLLMASAFSRWNCQLAMAPYTCISCTHGAVLNFFASRSAVFSNTLHEVHVRQPSPPESPWKLVWYHDETTPGNILALDPTRKSTAIYWSFAELGFEALSKECFWMLGGILRYAHACEISGGMSCVFASHSRSFFGPEHNVATSGFTVHTHQGSVVIFARLGTVVADEAALKAAWSLKGASGLRPCAICSNVVGFRCEFDLDSGSALVDIACANHRNLKL